MFNYNKNNNELLKEKYEYHPIIENYVKLKMFIFELSKKTTNKDFFTSTNFELSIDKVISALANKGDPICETYPKNLTRSKNIRRDLNFKLSCVFSHNMNLKKDLEKFCELLENFGYTHQDFIAVKKYRMFIKKYKESREDNKDNSNKLNKLNELNLNKDLPNFKLPIINYLSKTDNDPMYCSEKFTEFSSILDDLFEYKLFSYCLESTAEIKRSLILSDAWFTKTLADYKREYEQTNNDGLISIKNYINVLKNNLPARIKRIKSTFYIKKPFCSNDIYGIGILLLMRKRSKESYNILPKPLIKMIFAEIKSSPISIENGSPKNLGNK